MLEVIGVVCILGCLRIVLYEYRENIFLKQKMKECSLRAQAWSVVRTTAVELELVPVGNYLIQMVMDHYQTYFVLYVQGEMHKQIFAFGCIEEWDKSCCDNQMLEFNITEQEGVHQYYLENVGFVHIETQSMDL